MADGYYSTIARGALQREASLMGGAAPDTRFESSSRRMRPTSACCSVVSLLQMLEDIAAEALRALEQEAARLTEWFGGTRVLSRFPSPLSKIVADPGE